MASLHAKRQDSEEKLHGDKLESANEPAPTNIAHQQPSEGGALRAAQHPAENRSIPAAERGGHSRSQAAHLSGPAQDHKKPSTSIRQPGQERQPPMEISRAGKDFRRQ